MSRPASLRARLARAVADRPVVEAVHAATWRKVDRQAAALAELRQAEALRRRAVQIRQHTLENLPYYLEQFVQRAEALGAEVHLASDGPAACRIVVGLALQRGLKLAVKAKSMTSEEIRLNEALEAAGVQVVETDLGEFIAQIDRDRPSHITAPIIHKNRAQIASAIARRLGCQYTEDVSQMTRLVREHLRGIFRRCDLGITGVNFAVAESGTLCLLTNEGNGRMTVTRPRVHVALMGIEKVIPRMSDLAVLLKLVARASNGQPMGAYTTLINGPRRPDDPDGPGELHIVLLDGGRSDILAGPFREVLRCIRCGACLNACPAYRNVGGHAYASVYPGPIGSLLGPLLGGQSRADLARISSLCGACRLACPVDIDIPSLLVRMRAITRHRQPAAKRMLMRGWAWVCSDSRLYGLGQKLLRWLLPDDGQGWAASGIGPLRAWTGQRDLLRPATQSFRQLWKERLRREPCE